MVVEYGALSALQDIPFNNYADEEDLSAHAKFPWTFSIFSINVQDLSVVH